MLVAWRSIMLLRFFLLHNSQAMDGCEGKFGRFYWKCGDVCISAHPENPQNCVCGDETFGPNATKWCYAKNCSGGECQNCTVGDCLERRNGDKQGDVDPRECDKWSPAICTNGVALPLNKSMKGKCNEYLKDKFRNHLSTRTYVKGCQNTSVCLKEGEGRTSSLIDANIEYPDFRQTICSGNSSCKGALSWCKREERKNETCLLRFVRCSSTMGGKQRKDIISPNGLPGQCIEDTGVRDGNFYHCIDRSDEGPFEKRTPGSNQQKIDFKKLISCRTKAGPGLECGSKGKSKCVTMDVWCSSSALPPEECPVLGDGVLTNDPRVCQEYNFWRHKPCSGNDYERCKASYSGQCVRKNLWGFRIKGYEAELDRHGDNGGCKDTG